MSRIFRPRALVRFSALLNLSRTTDDLQTVESTVRPRSVTVTRNDFNTADTAEIVLDVQNFPILPRMVRQVYCAIYMGDAATMDDPFVTDFAESTGDLCRFAGYVDDPEMSLDETDGTITWKLRDFTALFLEDKRPPPEVVPSYQDNLAVALRRLVNHVQGGSNIRLRLEQKGEFIPEASRSLWPSLASIAPKALANAKIPVKADDSTWEIIKRCCDPLSLIPSVFLDTLIVRSSRGLVDPIQRPVFLYGNNLVNYKEKRQTSRSQKGVAVTSYVASTHQPIIGFYPPPGDPAISKAKKPIVAAKEGNPAFIEGTEDRRDWFIHEDVASQAALNEIAFETYTQRARQEFEASFECRRMTVVDNTLPNDASEDEATFDVLGLQNGDRVMIGVEPDLRQLLNGIGDANARVQFLVDNGYSSDVAPTLVRAFETSANGLLEVYLRKFEMTVDDTGFSGKFDTQNLLTLQSSAVSGVAVTPTP